MEIQRRANIPPLGIAHRAKCDTHLLGYSIPEGTIILTSLYSVHMDQKFWKDPLAFRPERFFDQSGNWVVNEKYFAPFGYGKISKDLKSVSCKTVFRKTSMSGGIIG